MAIYRLDDRVPKYPASAYVAPQSIVIGQVTLGERVSVWPGAVVRADDDTIAIGDNTNVQDGAVLHVDRGCPMVIGANVTIVGEPAKLVRQLSPEQIAGLRPNVDTYVKRGAFYREKLVQIDD